MKAALEQPVVARDLLACLQAHTGQPDLGYAEEPVRLTGGRDTLVFRFRLEGAAAGLDRTLVARVFPIGPAGRPYYEAAIHRAVASQGYPTPAPVLVCERLEASDAPVLVMDFVPGRPLLADLRKPGRAMLRMPRLLAESHAALHRLDAAPLLDALAHEADTPPRRVSLDFVVGRIEQRVERCALALAPALRWLREHRPPAPDRPVICHGDFHPANVLAEGDRVSGVIDWPNVVVAEPEYDVGHTRHLLLAAQLSDLPAAVRPLFGGLRRYIVRAYTSMYRRLLPLDAARLRYFEAFAALNRLVEGPWRAASLPRSVAAGRRPRQRAARRGTSHDSPGLRCRTSPRPSRGW